MKQKIHIESLSNGLGAPSMYLLLLATQGKIPATVSICGDTGSELHRMMNDGSYMSAAEYHRKIVEPMASRAGVKAIFARAENKDKIAKPSLWEHLVEVVKSGELKRLHLPLFGSNGGRLMQSCTDNWKLAAIRQTGRKLGAKTMRSAIGLHKSEMWRRAEMRLPVISPDSFDTYQSIHRAPKIKKPASGGLNFETGECSPLVEATTEIKLIPLKWMTHYYPVGEGLYARTREEIRFELEKAGIPYIVTSECDMCPHKNWERWALTPPHVVQEIAEVESMMNGEFFFTDLRIPLLEALPKMQAKYEAKKAAGDADFGCSNGLCGV